jgi:hypothetical protein
MDEHPVITIERAINAARMSPPNVRRVFQVRRRVDHHDAHLVRGRAEEMRLVGREEAGVARAHLELLVRDLDVRAAFQQVADLLDAGVRVRQRALAPLDFADDDFEFRRSNQAVVLRAGVVGRGIRLDVRLSDQVLDGGIQL